MTQDPSTVCTAFVEHTKIAHGPLYQVARALEQHAGALVFDDTTGKVIDIDPRGYTRPETPKRRPGRPKMGVVAREVTLLQRHWDWLAQQSGGASAALRRLVDEARRSDTGTTEARLAQEAAYRFIHALAGDFPGYEEATRALFAGDLEAFKQRMAAWPNDILAYAVELASTHRKDQS